MLESLLFSLLLSFGWYENVNILVYADDTFLSQNQPNDAHTQKHGFLWLRKQRQTNQTVSGKSTEVILDNGAFFHTDMSFLRKSCISLEKQQKWVFVWLAKTSSLFTHLHDIMTIRYKLLITIRQISTSKKNHQTFPST